MVSKASETSLTRRAFWHAPSRDSPYAVAIHHPPVGVGLLLDRVGSRRLGRSQLALGQGTLLPGRCQFGLEPGMLPTLVDSN